MCYELRWITTLLINLILFLQRTLIMTITRAFLFESSIWDNLSKWTGIFWYNLITNKGAIYQCLGFLTHYHLDSFTTIITFIDHLQCTLFNRTCRKHCSCFWEAYILKGKKCISFKIAFFFGVFFKAISIGCEHWVSFTLSLLWEKEEESF